MSLMYGEGDPNGIAAASADDQLDPRLVALLDQCINTFVKWDLLRFFHAQPETADNAETVAQATGRDLAEVRTTLHEMAECNVLDELVLRSGERMYILTQERTLRTQVNSFILACDDDQFRIKAIYYVIRLLRISDLHSDDLGRAAL